MATVVHFPEVDKRLRDGEAPGQVLREIVLQAARDDGWEIIIPPTLANALITALGLPPVRTED